jgi:hypothetical protein
MQLEQSGSFHYANILFETFPLLRHLPVRPKRLTVEQNGAKALITLLIKNCDHRSKCKIDTATTKLGLKDLSTAQVLTFFGLLHSVFLESSRSQYLKIYTKT